MHPDKSGYIDDLHAHFRNIIVKNLSPEQLQLYDYFNSCDPFYNGEDCFDEFPLVDGLPALIIEEMEEEYELIELELFEAPDEDYDDIDDSEAYECDE